MCLDSYAGVRILKEILSILSDNRKKDVLLQKGLQNYYN